MNRSNNDIYTDDDHEINQPRFPCPCCKYDCVNQNCVLCDYCYNWFHQECAKLSDKRFNDLGRSDNLKYKCKFCSKKAPTALNAPKP